MQPILLWFEGLGFLVFQHIVGSNYHTTAAYNVFYLRTPLEILCFTCPKVSAMGLIVALVGSFYITCAVFFCGIADGWALIIVRSSQGRGFLLPELTTRN